MENVSLAYWRSPLREQILSEIRRLAKVNGGKPPGLGTFERETGIPEHAWVGVFWARWGDAVTEAGFQPNTRQAKIDSQFFFRKLAEAVRHFGKAPTAAELRMYRRKDQELPGHKAINNHFRSMPNMLHQLAE
jgi:hypothetical protein